MFQLAFEHTLPIAAPRIYDALETRLHTLPNLMPNVRRIELLDTRVEGGPVHPVLTRRDRWHAHAGIPLLAAWLGAGLSWTVSSRWYRAPYLIEWEVERPTLPIDVRAGGEISLEGAGAETRVRAQGTLSLEPPYPTWLKWAGGGVHKVEALIGQLLSTNLSALVRGAPQAIEALLHGPNSERDA